MTTKPTGSEPAALSPPSASSAPDDPRVLLLRERIAARLRSTCAAMDDEAFNRLVSDLARLKVSWADRYGERLTDE